MLTTREFLELAKQRLAARHELTLPMSDYRLGKLISVTQPTLSHWRTGKTLIDIKFAPVFADACELPLEYVLASLQHERATDERVKKALERIGNAFATATAAGMAGVFLSFGAVESTAENKPFSVGTEVDTRCLMRTRHPGKRLPKSRVPPTRTRRRESVYGNAPRL